MGVETQTLAAILERLATSPEDEDAWTDLYARMWPWVMGTIYRLLRGYRELAEDASQEVFIRLARYCPFGELREPDAFRAYLWTVCQNVARTYLHQTLRHREISLEELIETRSDLAESSELPPEQSLELKTLFSEILGQLDDKDRHLLNLLVQGYTLSEIADAAGLSYSNAGVRIHRLRRKLRNYLAIREQEK